MNLNVCSVEDAKYNGTEGSVIDLTNMHGIIGRKMEECPQLECYIYLSLNLGEDDSTGVFLKNLSLLIILFPKNKK